MQGRRKHVEQDAMVSWQMRDAGDGGNPDILYRYGFLAKLISYYHLFKKGELENLVLASCSNINIVSSGYDADNWYVIVEKIK